MRAQDIILSIRSLGDFLVKEESFEVEEACDFYGVKLAVSKNMDDKYRIVTKKIPFDFFGIKDEITGGLIEEDGEMVMEFKREEAKKIINKMILAIN